MMINACLTPYITDFWLFCEDVKKPLAMFYECRSMRVNLEVIHCPVAKCEMDAALLPSGEIYCQS